jgi:type I restriction enzyme M protein
MTKKQIDHEKAILNSFEEMSRRQESSTVWNGWLDWIITNWMLNGLYDKEYRNPDWNYSFSQEDLEIFQDMYRNFCLIQEEKISTGMPWYDFLGTFYENHVKSAMKARNTGQFFTPSHIVDVMVQISCDGLDNFMGKTTFDPCCGSGRMPVAAHAYAPGNYHFGADLDPMVCKMSVVNYIHHGVMGSVIWMDSLTQEFYCAWKCNEHILATDGVPHVKRVDSLAEAYNFTGLKWNNVEEKQENEILIEATPEKIEKAEKIIKDRQTTLFG